MEMLKNFSDRLEVLENPSKPVKTERLPPPNFVRDAVGTDSVHEFSNFVSSVGAPAVYLLAELAFIHNHRETGSISLGAAVPGTKGLFCRKISGWAIFYLLSGELEVTVILVAPLNTSEVGSLAMEAIRRSQLLGILKDD
jgi:hypothetical protein